MMWHRVISYAGVVALVAYCLHIVLSPTLSVVAKVVVMSTFLALFVYFIVFQIWRWFIDCLKASWQWFLNLLKVPLAVLCYLFTLLFRGLAPLSELERLVEYLLTISCATLLSVASTICTGIFGGALGMGSTIASGLLGALGVGASLLSRCVPSLPSLGRLPNFGVSLPKWRWPSFGKWGSGLRCQSRKPETNRSNDGSSLDATVLAHGKEQYKSQSVTERRKIFDKPFVQPSVAPKQPSVAPKQPSVAPEQPSIVPETPPTVVDDGANTRHLQKAYKIIQYLATQYVSTQDTPYTHLTHNVEDVELAIRFNELYQWCVQKRGAVDTNEYIQEGVMHGALRKALQMMENAKREDDEAQAAEIAKQAAEKAKNLTKCVTVAEQYSSDSVNDKIHEVAKWMSTTFADTGSSEELNALLSATTVAQRKDALQQIEPHLEKSCTDEDEVYRLKMLLNNDKMCKKYLGNAMRTDIAENPPGQKVANIKAQEEHQTTDFE